MHAESREDSPPIPTSSGANSSLTIEDTNRLRQKLGLKPLQIDSKSPHKKPAPKPRSRSPSPVTSSSAGGDSSLSIDATNKLRIKLGLKPLQIGSGPPQRERPPAPSRKSDINLEDGETEDAEEFDEATLQRIQDEREKEGETFWKEKQDFVHAPPGKSTFH